MKILDDAFIISDLNVPTVDSEALYLRDQEREQQEDEQTLVCCDHVQGFPVRPGLS